VIPWLLKLTKAFALAVGISGPVPKVSTIDCFWNPSRGSHNKTRRFCFRIRYNLKGDDLEAPGTGGGWSSSGPQRSAREGFYLDATERFATTTGTKLRLPQA
jgi:hypothetical protein